MFRCVQQSCIHRWAVKWAKMKPLYFRRASSSFFPSVLGNQPLVTRFLWIVLFSECAHSILPLAGSLLSLLSSEGLALELPWSAASIFWRKKRTVCQWRPWLHIVWSTEGCSKVWSAFWGDIHCCSCESCCGKLTTVLIRENIVFPPVREVAEFGAEDIDFIPPST